MFRLADGRICGICARDKPQDQPDIFCGGQDICIGCHTTMVTRVLEDQDTYPAKLDNKTPFDYASFLDQTLLEQYSLKEIEHGTFPSERVFCSCGKFIGRLIKLRPGEEYIAVKTCLDSNCQRYSCLICMAKLEELGDIIDHHCKERRQANEEDMQKMIKSVRI